MPTVEVGVMTRRSPRPNTESSAPVARRMVLSAKPWPASSRRLLPRSRKASLPTAKMSCAPLPVSMRAPAAMRVSGDAGWPLTMTWPLASYTERPAGSGCGRRPKNCARATPAPAASRPAASAFSRNARRGSSASPVRLAMDLSLSPDRWATYYHAQAHRRGSLMPRYLLIAAALLLVASPPPARAAEGWRYGISADAMVDDNVTRGLYDADVESDSVLSVEGSAVRSLLLGPRSGAVFRAAARYSQFLTFSDLSNLALSGRAAWRTQPGLNFSSPVFEVAGNLVWLQHADSELRDGTIVTIEGSVGSHLTDRVRLGAGLAWDQRNGGDPGRPGEFAIYDIDNTRLWASLDYRFGTRTIAYARILQVDGDQVFNSVT